MDKRVQIANRHVALEQRMAVYPALFNQDPYLSEEAIRNIKMIDSAEEIELTDDLILKDHLEYLLPQQIDQDIMIFQDQPNNQFSGKSLQDQDGKSEGFYVNSEEMSDGKYLLSINDLGPNDRIIA